MRREGNADSGLRSGSQSPHGVHKHIGKAGDGIIRKVVCSSMKKRGNGQGNLRRHTEFIPNTESLTEKALGFKEQRSGDRTFQEEGMVFSKDPTGGNCVDPSRVYK